MDYWNTTKNSFVLPSFLTSYNTSCGTQLPLPRTKILASHCLCYMQDSFYFKSSSLPTAFSLMKHIKLTHVLLKRGHNKPLPLLSDYHDQILLCSSIMRMFNNLQYFRKRHWEIDYFHASIQSFKYNFQNLTVNICPININVSLFCDI